ncbi:MAG: hypothetical protein ABI467_08080 [Kofleriaceae bacterium]
MRGDEHLQTSQTSQTSLTEIYERPQTPRPGPAYPPSSASVAPIAYVPVQRYEIPTLAPNLAGGSSQVRIGERLDATYRVERVPRWHRVALVAGIIGAIVAGVGVGVVVSMSGAHPGPAPAAVRPIAHHMTVTPIVEDAPSTSPAAPVSPRGHVRSPR